MPIYIEFLTLQLKQQVVQKKTSPLMVLIQVLNPFPLLEHTGFDTIPLSQVVNSEVVAGEQETYPGRLLIKHGPYTIGDRSRIAHRPCGRIKGPIPRPWIDDPMTKEFVQYPLVSG